MSHDAKIFLAIIFISITITLIISAIVASSGGKKFDGNTFWTITLIVIIILSVGTIVLSIPSIKGKIGEFRVSLKLNRLSRKYGGYVINNVIIPGEGNKTSQIDHIYVCRYGIYVVETKNYTGRIYGRDGQQDWTQVLAYGKEKHKLYNPVKQNLTHIIRLKDLLDLTVEPISVVVFVKANISNVSSDYVYEIHQLKRLVRVTNVVLEDREVEKIASTLMEHKNNPVKTAKEHVKEVKLTMHDVSNNVCPRCGGNLVLRKSINGEFYGCSNYPKCTFTKKI